MQIFWVAAFFVVLPLMIILHAAVACIVECLFWSAIIARFVLIVVLFILYISVIAHVKFVSPIFKALNC